MIIPWEVVSHGRAWAVLMVLGLALGARPAAAQFYDPTAIPESGGVPAPGPEAGAQPCPVEELCPSVRPFLYFQADGLLLQRRVLSPRVLASAGSGSDTAAISANDLSGSYKAGSNITIGHTLGSSPYQVELSYFAIGESNESKSAQDASQVLLLTTYTYQQLYATVVNPVTSAVTQVPIFDTSGNPIYTITSTTNTYGTGNLYSPFTNYGENGGMAGYDYNYRVAVQQTSYLDNGELNLRRSLTLVPGFLTGSLLVGARYMGLREGLDYQSYSYLSRLDSAVEQNGSSLHVNTRTSNNLWGGQLGGVFEIYCDHGISLDCGIKAALCNNNMSQETFATLDGTSADYANRGHSKSASGMTYVIDMDFAIVCRPWSHVAARAGYQMLWMSGVALASRNFSPDYQSLSSASADPSWIDTQGTVLYHGPHVGVEVSW